MTYLLRIVMFHDFPVRCVELLEGIDFPLPCLTTKRQSTWVLPSTKDQLSGFYSHRGIPIAGWFTMENPNHNSWMITGGYHHDLGNPKWVPAAVQSQWHIPAFAAWTKPFLGRSTPGKGKKPWFSDSRMFWYVYNYRCFAILEGRYPLFMANARVLIYMKNSHHFYAQIHHFSKESSTSVTSGLVSQPNPNPNL